MPPVFLDWAEKPLLVVHTLVGFALLGALTHLALVAVGELRGGRRARLVRIYAQVVGATFAVAFAIGLLMYPGFRYQVRGLYLDRYAPWASNLFDMKENLLALGLPLSVLLFFLGRRYDTGQESLRPLLATSALLLWGVVVFGVVAGVLVTSVRGV